jgi:hypothetical protein
MTYIHWVVRQNKQEIPRDKNEDIDEVNMGLYQQHWKRPYYKRTIMKTTIYSCVL